MSKFQPITVVDSSDSECGRSPSENARASFQPRASIETRTSIDPRVLIEPRASLEPRASIEPQASIEPRALVTILPSTIQPLASSSAVSSGDSASALLTHPWKLGTRLRNDHSDELKRIALLDSSDSETETETELNTAFKTPPSFKVDKALWEAKQPNTKMGDDVGKSQSPSYDPFGPSSSDDDEKKRELEDDYHYAVFLDMDINGRTAKSDAKKRLKDISGDDQDQDEPPYKKNKDRTLYWKKRYAIQKASKLSKLNLDSVKTYFCGEANIYRQTYYDSHCQFKRAKAKGGVQNDLIISSDKGFYRTHGDSVSEITPDENGNILVKPNCTQKAELLFRETFV